MWTWRNELWLSSQESRHRRWRSRSEGHIDASYIMTTSIHLSAGMRDTLMYLTSRHIDSSYSGSERHFDVSYTTSHQCCMLYWEWEKLRCTSYTTSHRSHNRGPPLSFLPHIVSSYRKNERHLDVSYITPLRFLNTSNMRHTFLYFPWRHIDSFYSENERDLYKSSYREWEKHRCSLRNVMLISRCSQHFLQWESETLHVISMIASHLVGSQEKWEKFLTSRHNASYTKYKICFYAGSWVKGCKSLLEIRRKLWN